MRFNKIAIACGVAFAAFAGSAAAQNCGVTGYNPYTCPTDVGYDNIFITGATAPDNFIQSTVESWLEAGFVRIVDNVDGRQQRGWVGRIKTGAAADAVNIPATHRGKSVRIVKRSTGGSVFGVNPVARNQFLAVLDMKNTLGNCAGTTNPRTCGVVGVDFTSGQRPTLGVSDLNPEMFKTPFNTEFDLVLGAPSPQLTVAETNGLEVRAANVLSMGIVATDSVPDTAVFTRAIYGELLRAGGYTTWDQVDAALTASGNLNAKPQVVVCRRVPGSGTQTSYNWFFHAFPCAKGGEVGDDFNAPKRMSDSVGYDPDGDGERGNAGEDGSARGAKAFTLDPTLGVTIVENSTSGNVRDCLEKAEKGGIHEFRDEEGKWVKVDFGTGGYGAIGVLSLDSLNNQPKNPAAPDACNAATGQTVCGWSFRTLDGAGRFFDSNNTSTVTPTLSAGATGIAPSKANLRSGAYQFAVELTFQYNKTAVPAGTTRTLVNDLVTAFGAPGNNTQEWVAALPPQPFGPNVTRGSRNGQTCGPFEFVY